jgi:gas vesicle protein
MAKVIIKVSKSKINKLDKLIDNSNIENMLIDEKLELLNKINKLLSEILHEISDQMRNCKNNNFSFETEVNCILSKAFKVQNEVFLNIDGINVNGMNNYE